MKNKLPIKPIILSLFIFVLLLIMLIAISSFFDKWQLKFQSPIIFQKPILIEPRKDTFISPISVEAKEPIRTLSRKRTWAEVLVMIVDRWSKHGKKATYEAIKVFECESGLNEYAYNKNTNGTTDSGVAQVNSVHKQTVEAMWDAEKNLDFALALYERQGFSPWVCAKKLGIK